MTAAPRTRLANLPTPLVAAPRLSEEIGVEVLLKRDDLTGVGLGGNKARAIEFHVGAAEAAGADVFVTGGGPRSNWVLTAAVGAAARDLKVEVVLFGDRPPAGEGSLELMDRLDGVGVVFTGDPARPSVDPILLAVVERLRRGGHRPYVVGRGGADAVGALGYLFAVDELDAQLSEAGVAPRTVWLATGSCGTQAGLVAGHRQRAGRRRIVGVSVHRPVDECRRRIEDISDAVLDMLAVEERYQVGWGGAGSTVSRSGSGRSGRRSHGPNRGDIPRPRIRFSCPGGVGASCGRRTGTGGVPRDRRDTEPVLREFGGMIEPPEGYLGLEGRVVSGPSPQLVEAGYRLEVDDARILHYGLCLADLAHILELVEAEVVPDHIAASLCREILDFLSTHPESFPYDPVYGDAYNSRERELERRLGAVAGWLPTGRTRREAGRLALRIALRDRLLDMHDAVVGFATALVGRATELADVPWNDTTYLQPAQPSSFGHYLAGFAEQATRDLDRIRRCHRWVNRAPAGSGGVGGTAIPIDRTRLSDRLGFEQPTAHIRDGMWSADAMIDCAVAAVQATLNADRLAEDLEIFASPQFGYVMLGGSSSRASVMLPQKRNPYALAVIRGGCGTLIGRATGLMTTQRTPSARTDNWLYAYGEVIGAVELASRLVRLAADVVATMQVDIETLTASAGDHFSTATDLAEHLVLEQGLDYRNAYRIVGIAVADAAEVGEERLGADHLDRAARAVRVRTHGFRPRAREGRGCGYHPLLPGRAGRLCPAAGGEALYLGAIPGRGVSKVGHGRQEHREVGDGRPVIGGVGVGSVMSGRGRRHPCLC